MGLIDFLHEKGASVKNKCLLYISIWRCRRLQRRALAKLQGKDVINCVFFALFPSIWKYDRVYRLMEHNKRFNPIILVCPVVNYGKENMIEQMNNCYSFFYEKGYNVIKSFSDNTYVDVKNLDADILFYTNPYDGLIDQKYYITNYLDKLTVYVPYFINCSNIKGFSNNLLLHNLVWRKYAETEYEIELAREQQVRHGENVVNVGYPGIESLIDKTYIIQTNPWKLNKQKRIIWAPHHTIEGGGNGHTCFLKYCHTMLDFAKKYQQDIQIVFKPHPILRRKLDNIWGKEKTDAYYSLWDSLPNTSLNEGDYIDLFLTSDAMIHDSGSFIVEYLYVNKPVMRTVSDIPLSSFMNRFGLECLDVYYMANNEKDIELFIQNVINNVDPLRQQRERFVNNVLMPKGSPSQNIIDDIIDSIDNQILYRN